jgi:hypothetical protein
VLFRNRAQAFPPDRIFGVDFRRGMSIEWAELAQNLDVPRVDAFDLNYKAVDEALKASSNHTINLLHEPSRLPSFIRSVRKRQRRAAGLAA